MRLFCNNRTFLAILLFIILTAVGAPAASRADGCQQEEESLRTAEAAECSGMSYIFNPSACFNTRKALVPYDQGKCQANAANGGGGQKPVPIRGGTVAPPLQPAIVSFVSPGKFGQEQQYQLASVPVAVGTSLDQLKGEVALLRDELDKLKAEVLRLHEELSRLREENH